MLGYARLKATQLGTVAPVEPGVSAMQKKYESLIPALAPSVKGREFQISANERYGNYMKDHPDALKSIGVTAPQAGTILNYINGKRSITEIRSAVAGELDEEVPLESVVAYLELLRTIQWVVFQ